MSQKQQRDLIFPKGFFWGASTASYQVSGCENTQWSELESSQKRIDDLVSSGEIQKHGLENFLCGSACEHDKHFREDFMLAQSLGHNATRCGSEPARVMPRKGFFDDTWLAHYKEVVRVLRELNITVFFNLWHWTLPIWWEREGGWESPNAPAYFAAYVEKVVKAIGDDVEYWITLNEPNVFSKESYVSGLWPPQKKSNSAARTVIENLIKAHKKAYEIIKRQYPHAQIGIAQHIIWTEMSENTAIQKKEKQERDREWNWRFLDAIHNHQDFVGVNNYGRQKLGGNENRILSDMGWELYPEAMYHAIVETYERYRKPIVITENGLADAEDTHRGWFILETLKWVHRAIQNHVPVLGYLHWSLMDNFEWAYGFWPRFGLLEIDRNTLERKIRPSAYFYRDVCVANGITEDIVNAHQSMLVLKPSSARAQQRG